MDRRILRRVFTVVAIIIAVIFFVMFALQHILDDMYYRPDKKIAEGVKAIDMSLSVRWELGSVDKWEYTYVKNTGIGSYDIHLGINQKGHVRQFCIVMKKGFLSGESRAQILPQTLGFDERLLNESTDSKKTDMEKIKMQVDDAEKMAVVRLKSEAGPKEIVKFCKKHGIKDAFIPVKIKGTDAENQKEKFFYLGTSLTGKVNDITRAAYDERKYPYLELPICSVNVTGKMVAEHFKSMLRYADDDEAFRKATGDETSSYKEALRYIKVKGIKSPGLVITEKAGKLAELADDEKVEALSLCH